MEAFDETDFRVLRELWTGEAAYFRAERVSMEEIARAVGVHRSTVAARLAKWVRTGFMPRVSVDVDPCALGLVGANVQLHARVEDLERAVDTVALVEGVSAVLQFDHGWLACVLYADSEAALARTVRLLEAILDADDVVEVSNTRRDHPDAQPVPLTRLDARLIMALREDGRRMPRELADELGVTPRTVERRLQRLRDEEVITTFPILRVERVTGMVVGYLLFELPREGRDKALRAALERAPDYVGRQTASLGPARLNLYGATPGRLEQMARDVARVPGVSDVTLRFVTATRHPPAFDAWLAERLARHARTDPGELLALVPSRS